MTDLKVTQFTAGTPVATDILPYVSNPGGAPISKYSVISNFAPLTTKGDIYAFGTVNSRLPVGTNGQIPVANSGTALGMNYASRTFAIPAILGNGKAVITAGTWGWMEMPFGGSLTSWRMNADASGTIVTDVYKSTYADLPFGTADTITASSGPSMAGTAKAQDTTLSGWTKTFSAGDWLAFVVVSASTIKQATLSLRGVITDVS